MKFTLVLLFLFSSISFAGGPTKVCSAVCELSSNRDAVIGNSAPYSGFYSQHYCFSAQAQAVNQCYEFGGLPKGEAFSCYATSTVNVGEVCELRPGKYVLNCEIQFGNETEGLNLRCEQMHGVLVKGSLSCDYVYEMEGYYFDQCH